MSRLTCLFMFLSQAFAALLRALFPVNIPLGEGGLQQSDQKSTLTCVQWQLPPSYSQVLHQGHPAASFAEQHER